MNIRTISFAARSKVEIKETTLDEALHENQVLIKTVVTMISPGTELAALTGTHSKSNMQKKPSWLCYPSVPGYLAAGTIIKTGCKVTKFKTGDRVVCEGSGVWNSHQSHIIMDDNDFKLIPVAPEVSFNEAVFTKIGSIAMTGVRVCKPELGDSVAILGLGLVGQVAARLALLAGAGQVICVDPLESRRKLVEDIKGIIPVKPDDELLNNCVVPGNKLSGFDHVIEASGHPSAFLQACEIARVRGKVAILSAQHKPVEIRIYDYIHCKGLQILGAHGFILADPPNVSDRWSDGEQRRIFMKLLAEKRLNMNPLISHRVSFEKAPQLYMDLMSKPSEYLGVQFIWNE